MTFGEISPNNAPNRKRDNVCKVDSPAALFSSATRINKRRGRKATPGAKTGSPFSCSRAYAQLPARPQAPIAASISATVPGRFNFLSQARSPDASQRVTRTMGALPPPVQTAAALPSHGFISRTRTTSGLAGRAEESSAFSIHRVFSNLKTWLAGTHHGVDPAYLPRVSRRICFTLQPEADSDGRISNSVGHRVKQEQCVACATQIVGVKCPSIFPIYCHNRVSKDTIKECFLLTKRLAKRGC